MSERDRLQSIWQNQTQEEFSMSLADIHARAEKFQSGVRARNWREYIAGAIVVAYFSWLAVTAPEPLIQAGAVLIVLSSLLVSWTLYQRARASSQADLNGAQSLAGFHRAELVRQRAALKAVWRWYLGPFIPGLVVFLAGVAFGEQLAAPLAAKIAVFGLSVAIVGALFAGVAWLNARAVEHLDAEIAKLDQAGL